MPGTVALPTEVWSAIVGLLPRRDLKMCLLLSRLHHDIAFSDLFSHVTVTFGPWIWRESAPNSRSIHSNNELDCQCEHLARRNNHSWDLLDAITCRSDFGKVIKKVTVRAYTWEDGDYVSEMGCLIKALEVLPNICAFRWLGEHPMPLSKVFEALARGSTTKLTELHIPVLKHMASVLQPAYRFSSLQFLSLVFPEDMEVDTHDGAIQCLLDTRAPTITSLSISGEIIWSCQSLGSFRALQELELIYTTAFDSLGDILVNCTTITSLTILPTEYAYLGQLFTALEEHPDTLAKLTAFKYLAPNEGSCMITLEKVHSLCKFLKNKLRLRRLHVRFDGIRQVEYPLLELLPALPALEVLGFNFVRRRQWLPEDILPFERGIPTRVSALCLDHLLDHGVPVGVVNDQLDRHAPCREAWLKLFKSRTSLRYLHILEFPTAGTGEPNGGNRGLTFHPLAIEDLPSSLELFGNRADIYPILRKPLGEVNSDSVNASPSPVFGPCWSLEKIAFRTAEDFGCADWEWLLRWYEFNSLNSYRTGVLKHGVSGKWMVTSD